MCVGGWAGRAGYKITNLSKKRPLFVVMPRDSSRPRGRSHARSSSAPRGGSKTRGGSRQRASSQTRSRQKLDMRVEIEFNGTRGGGKKKKKVPREERVVPLEPPPAMASAQGELPKPLLDDFDSVAKSVSGYSFAAGALTGGRADEESEDFLLDAGLQGAAAYDLRKLEMEVMEVLAAASDDDMGVGMVDQEFEEDMGAIGRASSFAERRSSPSPGRRGRLGPLLGAGQLSPLTSPMRGRRSKKSTDAFEDRARQLSEKRQSAGITTKDSVEEAALSALVALDARHASRPRPTPVSDMGAVLGWLERHLDESKIAHGRKITQTTSASSLGTDPNASSFETMLSKWKKRATAKVEARAVGGQAAVDAIGGGSPDGAKPSMGGLLKSVVAMSKESSGAIGGKGSPGDSKWLSALADDLEQEIAPEEMRVDVWERQRQLEQKVEEQIAVRAEERRQRRVARREARLAQARAVAGSYVTESDIESDDDDEQLEASFSRPRDKSAAPRGVDESVHKFLQQLPMLDEMRQAAKQRCFEQDHALRNTLGRRPTEQDRREDEEWVRMAMKFKEADQAYQVAKSLTTWDD